MIKKADIFLIAFLLLAGFGFWWLFSFPAPDGDTVTISIEGEPGGSYPLSENREIPIIQGGFENTIVIRDGTVYMKKANCPGKECVRQGRISQSGESIICLPHRIVVEITAQNSSYDAIVS